MSTKYTIADFSMEMTPAELSGLLIDTGIATSEETKPLLAGNAKTITGLPFPIIGPVLREVDTQLKTVDPAHPERVKLGNWYGEASTIHHTQAAASQKAMYSVQKLAEKLTALCPDQQTKCSVWRALGNSAVIQRISIVTAHYERLLTDPEAPEPNLGFLNFLVAEAAAVTDANAMSEYDKVMTQETALIFLSTAKTPQAEIIDQLAAMTNLSANVLTMLATADAKERAQRIRKHKEDTLAYISTHTDWDKLSIVESHQFCIRVIRAWSKTKEQTLKYMLRTSRLDRLGTFALADGIARQFKDIGQTIELDYMDELEETGALATTTEEAWTAYNLAMPAM